MYCSYHHNSSAGTSQYIRMFDTGVDSPIQCTDVHHTIVQFVVVWLSIIIAID